VPAVSAAPAPPETPVLVDEAPPSAAGPAPEDAAPVRLPPAVREPRALQAVRFNVRQIEFVFRARRRLGETFRMYGPIGEDVVVTSHPDHARSLFTADPELAPSLTGESPLRPIVGPSSVLTLVGPEHMRQRRLLLPPFHGEAVARYTEMIAHAAEREIEAWPLGGHSRWRPRCRRSRSR